MITGLGVHECGEKKISSACRARACTSGTSPRACANPTSSTSLGGHRPAPDRIPAAPRAGHLAWRFVLLVREASSGPQEIFVVDTPRPRNPVRCAGAGKFATSPSRASSASSNSTAAMMP